MFTCSKVLQVTGVVVIASMFTGCGADHCGTATSHSSQPSAKQEESFAKLSEEDRPLAKAQGYCAVTGEPLGSMGTPIKLILKEQPIFICCKGCEKKAKANPDKALEKVAELKAKVSSEKAN